MVVGGGGWEEPGKGAGKSQSKVGGKGRTSRVGDESGKGLSDE